MSGRVGIVPSLVIPSIRNDVPSSAGPAAGHRKGSTKLRNRMTGGVKRFANVSSVEVNLTKVFETFREEIPDESENPKLDLSLANTRARLRMTTLYFFAGIHELLVAGTGNKVEDFGVGFYTKYGDGGVDLSPIADLMKSEIYDLARYLKVPDSILNAKPTDGLFGDDRSDEDQLGASYDELEWAMTQTEKGKNSDAFTGREREVFVIFSK